MILSSEDALWGAFHIDARRHSNAPTQIAWYIGLALAVISLISVLFTIPFINNNILFALIPLAGLVVMLVATALKRV